MSITITKKLAIVNGFVEIPNSKSGSKTAVTVSEALSAISGSSLTRDGKSIEFPSINYMDGYPSDWFAALNSPVRFNPDSFIIEVDTTKTGSTNNTFVLPTIDSGYNAIIDWGDGSRETVTGDLSNGVTHVYSTSGTYDVSIIENTIGGFPTIQSGDYGDVFHDALKITDIKQWGSGQWSTLYQAFGGCTSLTTASATDAPNLVDDPSMDSMFYYCSSLKKLDVSGWDVSLSTDMWGMFDTCSSLTSLDVSNWDTSSVILISDMFYGCASLASLDVSKWNVSGVDDMWLTFGACPLLASLDLSEWNTSNVTTMAEMFTDSTSLDVDVSGFDISNLTDAGSMMDGTSFSQINYDKLLIAWDAQANTNGIDLHAGTAVYGAGAPATARGDMVTDGWNITDGGPA